MFGRKLLRRRCAGTPGAPPKDEKLILGACIDDTAPFRWLRRPASAYTASSHRARLHALMTPAQPNSRVLHFLLPSVRDIIFIFLFWSLLAGPLSNCPFPVA